MKTTKFILALLLLLAPVLLITSCDDDDDPATPSPTLYFNAVIKYNSTPPQTYASDEYNFDARVYPTGDDTLVFEGERSADNSYMYFNLITPDLYQFTAGDSIIIPFDINNNTTVFCSLLINSVSTSIFQPGGGIDQGKVYIDEIDYSTKRLKGRVYGTFYSGNDTLKVSNGSFLIDL